jgi:hypothetical protein
MTSEKDLALSYLSGLHSRLGADSPVSLIDSLTAKLILKRITDSLVVRLESSWRPQPDAPEEHNSTTYLLRAGMFCDEHWSALLGVLDLVNPTINVHEAPFPKLLGAIFLDGLAGSEFDGCEVNRDPDMTLVVDWKYENVLACSWIRRIQLINKVREFLGKTPYTD